MYQAARYYSVTAWVTNLENKAQVQYGDYPLSRVVIN
jgi:hypothetical protein